MDHTKSLKHEHRLHNIVVPEFRHIRAARVVSRDRDFNTLPIELSFHSYQLHKTFVV